MEINEWVYLRHKIHIDEDLNIKRTIRIKENKSIDLPHT